MKAVVAALEFYFKCPLNKDKFFWPLLQGPDGDNDDDKEGSSCDDSQVFKSLFQSPSNIKS